jgi:hypothetical protein
MDGVRRLQQGVGNRATAALLQRMVVELATSGRPVFYSDVTGRFYGSRRDGERDEEGHRGLRDLVGEPIQDQPEAVDPNWDSRAIFAERMAAARAGGRELTSLEELIAGWAGDTQRPETAAGTVTMRRGRGRGNQVYIQSRLADYANARVGLDYNSICRVLDNRSPERIEQLAWCILRSVLGEAVSFRRYDDETRRAAAHLIGITQLAEEHAGRTPGSAEFARAGLLAVADGMHTFTQVFSNDARTLYPAASSAQAMRDAAAGLAPVSPTMAGNMEWIVPPESEQ